MQMSLNDLVLFAIIAAGAFYLGYQFGRLKTLAERGNRPMNEGNASPLPGPLDQPYNDPAPAPQRRGPPPPTSAGSDGSSWSGGGSGGPPRRSSKPPPAAAGLMGTGEAEKSGKGQK